MKLNNFAPPTGGWREKVVKGTFRNSTIYVNENGASQSEIPEALARAERLENCVYSYTLKANNSKGEIEVFAPARFALDRDRTPAQRGYYEKFDEYSVFWSHSVKVIEEEIKAVNAKIFKIREDLEKFPNERKTLNAEINRLDEQLQQIKSRERTAQQRSDGLLSRVGKSHIKRDWQQTRVGSNFPAGEDFRSMFLERFLDFESFACDAVNCLDDLECKDSAAVLVSDVIAPVFNAAIGEIARRLKVKREILKREFNTVVPESGEDNIVKLFWYSTQQTQMLREIQALSEEHVLAMTKNLGGRIPELLAEMERQAEAGSIANDENSIRINRLLGFLLELQTVAELSDPRCFLQPAPGSRVTYKEGYCMEILSPGTKKFGRIQEGDQVEVVMCGLYFEDSTNAFATVKPVVPCLVRRLMKA
jgi:regulator of replication initiation timing